MHLGHIKYFKEAKTFGDILIVTLTPDKFVRRGPGRPVFNSEQRAEAIASLEVVDFVAVNEWSTAIKTIELIKPDIYVKGPDYKDHSNDVTGNIKLEENTVKEFGGDIRYTDDIMFSSTKIINQNIDIFNDAQKSYIDTIKKKYNYDEVMEYFNEMMTKNICRGEVIIDEYIACQTLGKAGKDPIMTLQKLKGEKYGGGALAIANHMSDFVNSVNIISYLGEEEEHKNFMYKNLKGNINLEYVIKSDAPTIPKLRYIDSNI